MDCTNLSISGHALRRMFERGIPPASVQTGVAGGEVIAEYPEDRPFPSVLLLGFVDGEPLHVIVARDPAGACVIVTAYRPDPALWSDDFRARRTRS